MKFKREHKYVDLHHEERLYKEVVYDTRPGLELEDNVPKLNYLKKAGTSKVRNSFEYAKEIYEYAVPPEHKRKLDNVPNIHETDNMKDPYAYMKTATPE